MDLFTTRHGLMALPRRHDLIEQALRTYGEWSEREIALHRHFIEPGAVVLDIGAYIGTHTLAYARAVGPGGCVHAFEPQPLAQQALARMRAENMLTQVQLHDQPVASTTARFARRDAQGDNAGGFALQPVGADAAGEVVHGLPLDALELTRCDFIKIDVEGMEAEVLATGRQLLAQCQPVIACECNFLNAGMQVLAWAQSHGYRAYGVSLPAFNPGNFNGRRENLFGDAAEVTLMLVPARREDLQQRMLSLGLAPVRHLDELALLMVRKPQYAAEVAGLAEAVWVPPRPLPADAAQGSGQGERGLVIVVPFYQAPELVEPLWRSLLAAADEMRALGARIEFCNDSPGHEGLQQALARCSAEAAGAGLELQVRDNAQNLGFIGTCNQAFARAVGRGEDVLLLNSDTVLFPGTVREMLAVAALDPMIGFVCPRSNNATLCTLPAGAEPLPPDEAWQAFRAASVALPRMTYVPTGVGFCMLIRMPLLAELGGFDAVYGRGYNEENDLVMRANRYGYRVALANRAFVWHHGEASFGQLEVARSEREQTNAQVLQARYPEYTELITRYFQSPAWRAERLLSEPPAGGPGLRIGFDFSDFGTYHNGTFEAGLRLLDAAIRHWPADVSIDVYMTEAAWCFHGSPGGGRIDRHDPPSARTAHAVLRMGQPFTPRSLRDLVRRAPVVGVFMLDTISADCGNLAISFDERLWHFTMAWSDVVFTNSAFTAAQLRRRYAVGPRTRVMASPHSFTLSQYAPPERTALRAELAALTGTDYLLVVGNKFVHKGLRPALDVLAAALPGRRLVALGHSGETPAQVVAIPSGGLSDADMDALYSHAAAVVFPSHYEGFGFPVVHALARSRPVYVRRLPPFEEAVAAIEGAAANVHWFEDAHDLARQLAQGVAPWQGEAARGEADGWRRSALEVLQALRESQAQIDATHVTERLRWLLAVWGDHNPVLPPVPPGRRESLRLFLAHYPRLLRVAMAVWPLVKAVRRLTGRARA